MHDLSTCTSLLIVNKPHIVVVCDETVMIGSYIKLNYLLEVVGNLKCEIFATLGPIDRSSEIYWVIRPWQVFTLT